MADSVTNFVFSAGAQNVKAQFYNKTILVYVEGEDDVIFWSSYFPLETCHIEEVGGCGNLKLKIDGILNNSLKCIVACDSDYSYYHPDTKEHDLIVRTGCHSIECMMYCPCNLNWFLQTYARNLSDFTSIIEDQYNQFQNDICELVIYEIANDVYDRGLRILGDSCLKFMKNQKSVVVDSQKVEKCLNAIRHNFTKEEIDAIREKYANDPRSMRQIAKGHFQTSFVINLLRIETEKVNSKKKTNLTADQLFTSLVKCTDSCKQECTEKREIKKKCTDALSYFLSEF